MLTGKTLPKDHEMLKALGITPPELFSTLSSYDPLLKHVERSAAKLVAKRFESNPEGMFTRFFHA